VSGGVFVKVPDALLYDPELSDGALRAYLALAGYARMQSSDTFELTLDALGTLMGRSRDQAERRVKELQRRGLVVLHGRHDRRRPNRITVLDPQGVVFAGLHVRRDAADVRQPDAADLRHRDAADLRHPYIEGREEGQGQRTKRTTPLPSPVDNGGAPRPPHPRCVRPGHEHAGVRRRGECSACWQERVTGPAF
jgi:hypothetical protein